MADVIEVSYTGDLLAHRRCARAWAYGKQAGFYPYEQVQAMEGRLVHHAMEWLTRQYVEVHQRKRHATPTELEEQLLRYFRVLWARGIRTSFESKEDVLKRVKNNLFPSSRMNAVVKVAIEGAMHTEYELRSVRKLMGTLPGMKEKLLLTGILDLVVQQKSPLTYERLWSWTDRASLEGKVNVAKLPASPGDVEIWDYKATRASTTLVADYVRQLLTYAYLYRERTGTRPSRCVLFFINEPDPSEKLLAVELSDDLLVDACQWTLEQVKVLQQTITNFQKDPRAVRGGEPGTKNAAITQELQKQCTACGLRFDCNEYRTSLKLRGNTHPDIDIYNTGKN
ncbi:MAG TPA: PD-(D/E)XK nuclease family protein [Polyangia bacterium]|nr:PD-(D/E)XK nuclease family protein [Polyangia bacterium]